MITNRTYGIDNDVLAYNARIVAGGNQSLSMQSLIIEKRHHSFQKSEVKRKANAAFEMNERTSAQDKTKPPIDILSLLARSCNLIRSAFIF